MRGVDVDDRLAAEPRPATAATEGDLREVRRFFGVRRVSRDKTDYEYEYEASRRMQGERRDRDISGS